MKVSVQFHAPAPLPPGTHWTGGCVGLRVGLDAFKKNPTPAGNRTAVA